MLMEAPATTTTRNSSSMAECGAATASVRRVVPGLIFCCRTFESLPKELSCPAHPPRIASLRSRRARDEKNLAARPSGCHCFPLAHDFFECRLKCLAYSGPSGRPPGHTRYTPAELTNGSTLVRYRVPTFILGWL